MSAPVVTKKKPTLTTGKRKTAKARVVVTDGKGRVRINNIPVQLHQPIMAREMILEPFLIAGDVATKLDVDIKVAGGGPLGQAEAARMGLAQGLVKYTKSKRLKSTFIEHDRTMLSGDARRKEPKKFGGPSARRRKQKSYR
ncbi:MAG: 30S ribosomal protein S9 [Candidatus Bathyarchaeota archaeon]|nr:30S ribosomal protein S9 [Candidatus Bathyarchaeota archaeon]